MDIPAKEAEIFTQALAVPVGTRAAFIAEACGGDDALRRRVEALLQSHEEVGDFLEEAPDKAVRDARGAATADTPPLRIGRYKLLQQIGEGGCGVVFMAQQEEPVRRRVALKIIKPGMDTRSVIARFEAERQALALMDHPSIAKVFDAGATESGRPYFVMELVRGVKITEYCDEHSLTTEERLKLFIQVCAAIQHAHQKGIIHRDIKPSNILVTMTSEGVALPVVIDFGIAKPTTNQWLTDKTLFTAFEMFIGTPAYISPEQAALTSVDVDTRTDIYSLGVLLYELLTGLKPFDTTELLKEGIDEIRRVIREQQPVRPSTRLSKLNNIALTTVAQRRRSEPPKLIRAIVGDMDWIVMKALEKDRARRYETANGLALDVRRFLDHEAVLARPPSRLYKLRKSVQRNRLLSLGIAVVATLIVASLIAVSASLANERRARQDAETATQKARTEATRSQQVTHFLEEMLEGVGPSAARGRDTAMLQEILDRTAERVGLEMTNQPAVEADLRNLIGTLYQRLGNYAEAEKMHRAALAIRRRTFGSESLQVAASLNDLGLELVAQHKLADAESVVGEALAIRRRLLGNDHALTATSLNDLSAVYRDQGRLVEAEAMAKEALRIRTKPADGETLDIADSLRNLCLILGSEGRWPEAEAMAQDCLSIRQRLLGQDHPWVASALGDLAWVKSGQGKWDEADALNQEVLAMRQRLLPETHPDVASSLYSVGDRLRQKGSLQEAYSVLNATLSIQRKLLGADNPATLGTMHSLGLTLEADGKWEAAETLRRGALELWRKKMGNEDPQTLYAMRNLATALEGQHKWAEAETVHREVLAFWRVARGNEDPQSLYTLHRIAVILETTDKRAEAEAVRREIVSLSRKRVGMEDPDTLYAMRNLATTLEAESKQSEAEVVHREELAMWRKTRGDEDPQTLYTLGRLAENLEAQDKLPEGESVREEALVFWRKRAEGESAAALENVKGLVRVLNRQKKWSEAEKLLSATLTPYLIQQSSSLALLDLRLDLLAHQERWKEAVRDAASALKLRPTDHERFHTLAALLVATHDDPAYQQLCQEMLRDFGGSPNSYIADRIAKSCLLSPRSDVDLKVVDQLADTALAAGEQDLCMPLFKLVKGLSMFRLGNFEKAIEWTGKSLNSPFIHAQAQGYAILAMSHWRLGDKEKARTMLIRGDALAPALASADVVAQAENKWFPRLLARIQLEEARSLITDGEPRTNASPKEK